MNVDLRKTYDSIEWEFIRRLLAKLGFPFKFTSWMMECISTVPYSLVINGGLSKQFRGESGIGQGDPMSPYLFVLAIEYLQRELSMLRLNKDFKYHPRCKKFNVIIHLIIHNNNVLHKALVTGHPK